MNAAHLHITINHFPVICVLLGILVLCIGHWRRSSEITMVALVLFVLAAVVTVPTYYSGRNSSRVIRGVEGVVRDITRAHSGAATWAYYVTLVLGLLAAWGLKQWRSAGDLTSRVRGLVWIVAILAATTLARASLTGGKVRHTEARPDYVVPTEAPEEAGGPGAPGGAGDAGGTPVTP
ncbi:hypothetical protein DCC79_06290 [bacterium]|nr:hypothetical protein [Chloroflexi bacterium CFX6]RIL10995.1 MAG: hypothetical protein DCC79_06290 [bacterium]